MTTAIIVSSVLGTLLALSMFACFALYRDYEAVKNESINWRGRFYDECTTSAKLAKELASCQDRIQLAIDSQKWAVYAENAPLTKTAKRKARRATKKADAK